MFPNAGPLRYLIHSVEFQKRGLPHAHILCKYARDCIHPDDIDQVVSAEIPTDPIASELVRKLMVHHHPPADKPAARYCQRVEHGVRICRFGYPQQLQERTTVDSQGRVHYRRRKPGDEWVVPHCLPLLRKFECHLNFEAANPSHLFQYIFKYIHKSAFPHPALSSVVFLPTLNALPGPDYAKYGIRVANDAETPVAVDEIEDYWRGRDLSMGEAVWRIMGFNITKKEPSVTAMSVHLESDRIHQRYQHNGPNSLSTLLHYFARPLGAFTHNAVVRLFSDLTYAEYFTLFRLTKFDATKAHHENFYLEQDYGNGSQPMHVILRSSKYRHYARLREVPNARGELFYMRVLLQRRPASSFEDLRTVNGIQYATFQEAATNLGVFEDLSEAEYAFSESVRVLKTPGQLRFLFAEMLLADCILTPLRFWNNFKGHLTLDMSLRYPDAPQFATDQALIHISRLLEEHGKKPADYHLPQPDIPAREVEHELRKWAPVARLLGNRARARRSSFNAEQCAIFERIVLAVNEEQPLLLFIDGKAGVGKSFLINVLCDELRSRNIVVLPTATSAFAAQLYPGGRTLHSTFKVSTAVTVT
jgi:hypothetical protein